MLEQQNTKAEHVLSIPGGSPARPLVRGPVATPLLGYLPEQLKIRRDPVGYLLGLYRAYGTLSAWGGGRPSPVFSFGPELNQVVSNAEQFDWAPPAGKRPLVTSLDVLGAGILRMNGEEYKQRRRLIRPSFSPAHMEHWRDRMAALTRRTLEGWREGQQFNLHAEMRRLVVAISVSTAFDVEDPAAVRRFDKLIHDFYLTSVKPATRLLPYDVPGAPYRRMLRITDEIVATLKDFIRQSRGTDSMIGVLAATRDENGVALSETELLGEAFTMMNHDNLMTSLTWTLFLLAQHPSVYADTLDELHGVLRGGEATLEQLGRLPLLERVIKESLRLLPPFAFGRRFAAAACRFGPLDLPAGARVIFSPYVTHRLPEVYDEPNRFDPARWERLRPTLFEYLPFGAGSHHCLGMRFAMLELKVVLSYIIQRYRLEVVPGARIDRAFRLVLEPAWGVPVRLHRQDRDFTSHPVRGNIHEMVSFAS